jgi:hypothetical protein
VQQACEDSVARVRTIIAGSRGVVDYRQMLLAAAQMPWTPSLVISGHAPGADRLGERWARAQRIPLRLMPAEWTRYGRAAGHLRNLAMGSEAEALLALWDGSSQGTADMIEIAEDLDLVIKVWRVR